MCGSKNLNKSRNGVSIYQGTRWVPGVHGFGVKVMDDETREKRRYARVSAKACAWLQFQNESTLWGTVCVDLARAGARFSALRPVTRGSMVMIQLQLRPNAPAMECKSRICWSRLMPDGLYSFGVRFLDLTEDEGDRLAGFLKTAGGPALATV
jgi:PilZ domain